MNDLKVTPIAAIYSNYSRLKEKPPQERKQEQEILYDLNESLGKKLDVKV
jgi:hypothetical protein